MALNRRELIQQHQAISQIQNEYSDQLQWRQPCFNLPTMSDFGYEIFFPYNQISFTGFFIKTIKHFAEKNRNQLTENSLTNTKVRFKDDPIIQFFCDFLVSKKQFKRMFLLRQGDDYTILNEPHVLVLFRYIVSNLLITIPNLNTLKQVYWIHTRATTQENSSSSQTQTC